MKVHSQIFAFQTRDGSDIPEDKCTELIHLMSQAFEVALYQLDLSGTTLTVKAHDYSDVAINTEEQDEQMRIGSRVYNRELITRVTDASYVLRGLPNPRKDKQLEPSEKL